MEERLKYEGAGSVETQLVVANLVLVNVAHSLYTEWMGLNSE